ncbi:SDR family NAD(P)-dependent oxidoreductase, partial [bacterium M00.F.Ca.ET.177.01.1.1]
MLKDKITIISGAASGIGLEIAKVFLNEGAKVVFTDINQEALNHAVESFKANGFDCMGFTA